MLLSWTQVAFIRAAHPVRGRNVGSIRMSASRSIHSHLLRAMQTQLKHVQTKAFHIKHCNRIYSVWRHTLMGSNPVASFNSNTNCTMFAIDIVNELTQIEWKLGCDAPACKMYITLSVMILAPRGQTWLNYCNGHWKTLTGPDHYSFEFWVWL